VNEKIVLFDGVCNLCNFTVNFILDRDNKKEYFFAALQSDSGQRLLKENGLSQNEMSSVVLLKNGKYFQKSSAVLEIVKDFSWPYQILQLGRLLPAFIRDFIYDLIAKNRYKLFGKLATCRIPTPELKSRFLN
jgi:predicted DCC family thiol-disulfide oxidoreductase YuxK